MMQVKEVYAEFIYSIEESKTESTKKFYQGRLGPFAKHFAEVQFHEIHPMDLEEYFVIVNHWREDEPIPEGKRMGDPKAPDTVRGNISAVGTLQKFAIEELGVLKIPFELPKKPTGRKRTRLPTASEVEAIKENSTKSFCLIYEALRVCGAKSGHLTEAKISDWDRDRNILSVYDHVGTGKKVREIPVTQRLAELMLESIGERNEGRIFRTPHQLAWNPNSLSAAFRRAKNEAGIDAPIVLTSARHEHDANILKEKLLRDSEERENS